MKWCVTFKTRVTFEYYDIADAAKDIAQCSDDTPEGLIALKLFAGTSSVSEDVRDIWTECQITAIERLLAEMEVLETKEIYGIDVTLKE